MQLLSCAIGFKYKMVLLMIHAFGSLLFFLAVIFLVRLVTSLCTKSNRQGNNISSNNNLQNSSTSDNSAPELALGSDDKCFEVEGETTVSGKSVSVRPINAVESSPPIEDAVTSGEVGSAAAVAAMIVNSNLLLASESVDFLVLDYRALGMAWGALDASLQFAGLSSDEDLKVGAKAFFSSLSDVDDEKADLMISLVGHVVESTEFREGVKEYFGKCIAYLEAVSSPDKRKQNIPMEIFSYIVDGGREALQKRLSVEKKYQAHLQSLE